MGARQRHRRASRPLYAEWHDPPPGQPEDWRSTSPTIQSLRQNADRVRVSLDAVRRGLHTARFSAVSSGKDAKLRIIQYLKARLHCPHPPAQDGGSAGIPCAGKTTATRQLKRAPVCQLT